MEASASVLTPEELKLIIQDALREVLYLAFDQLDSGEELSLAAFARLLERGATETTSPTGSRTLREQAIGMAYAALHAKTLGDLSQAELTSFIKEVIREALPALLEDPDWGLELRDNLRDFLDTKPSNEPVLSLEEIKARVSSEK